MLGILLAGGFSGLALLTYGGMGASGLPLRSAWTGPVGAYLAFSLYQILGHASLLVPPVLVAGSAVALVTRRNAFRPLRILGGVACLVSASALLSVGWSGEIVRGGHLAGGVIGQMICDAMVRLFAGPGSFLILSAVLSIALVVVSGISPTVFIAVLASASARGGRMAASASLGLVRGFRSVLSRRGSVGAKQEDGSGSGVGAGEEEDDLYAAQEDGAPLDDDPMGGGDVLEGVTIHMPAGQPEAGDEGEAESEEEGPAARKHRRGGRRRQGAEAEGRGDFVLPSIELLDVPPPSTTQISPDQLRAMAEKLSETLGNYGVRGKVTEIHPGPVVTTLEFRPEKGTKISVISMLGDDLAMSLEVNKVRIVAPIPGKNAVGFELPSPSREMVFISEIMKDPQFSSEASRLPLAVGKDIIGRPHVMDLHKMPHLLIAGTTGSGKSVAINTMLLSLLFKYGPDDLKMILVDPKQVELQPYDGIPHLLLPVVTDMKHAASALKWAVDEMERRYQAFSDMHARDIASFNRRIEARGSGAAAEEPADQAGGGAVGEAGAGEEAPRPARLPYIIIVIDEFADLMMVAPREVEWAVSRLAAKARAAGIHLIVATQRPSVNVVTGLIKANFPCRIAFKVASKVDSRVMLDANGAESLLGGGDMLILPPGTSDLKRVHGGYVSDDEIRRVVGFLKEQADPTYREEILQAGEEDDILAEELGGEVDEMWDQAVAIVTSERKASISRLQRKLGIGYNRAARMVERMEMSGIVGPAMPGKNYREVLAPPPPPH